MQPIDRGILAYLLIRQAGHIDIEPEGLLPEESGQPGYELEYIQKLSHIDDTMMAFLIRQAALHSFYNRNLTYGVKAEDTTIYLMAQYCGVDVEGIKATQAEKAAKRQASVSKRLEQLAEQKAQLNKPLKAATKKVSKSNS